MTLTEGLEAAAVDIVKKVYVLSLNEGNIEFDKLMDSQFPIILVIPWVVDDEQEVSGRWQSETRLQGWILKKDDAATVDYDTTLIMKNICEPMRLVGKQFFKKLNKQDVIDKQTSGVSRVKYTPVFGEFDGHLHGVMFEATVPFFESVTCVS